MISEIDEARDWLGNEVNCAACVHELLLATAKCKLMHACVNDRYARRIDRFFNWNQHEANAYLNHPHFEVRAIAASHADIFLLAALLDDPDETVRWNAARRLPRNRILKLRTDLHREVRIRIASRLDDSDLIVMMGDPDYYVRLVIARRISPSLLTRFIHDEEAEVRRVVARRVPVEWLFQMSADADATVRWEVAQRLAPDLLDRLLYDPDWRVRFEVARRIPATQLSELMEDADPLVCEMAQSRLIQRPSQIKTIAQ